MSSSSSSECDCGECCYYPYSQDRNYGGNVGYGQTPFYPTMGQPLVYYTHVHQPPMRRQRSRESSKRNPNCFVKAFRWYTQELVPVPQRGSQDFNRNMNGFATWLDSKYDEFIKQGRFGNSSMVHLKFKQTSVLQVDTIPQSEEYNKCTTKKFGRMRSPWKKKRRQRMKTGAKSSQSCEFILRPKDLCRPTSESCHVSPTTNYNPSNTTIMKSQSLVSVPQDKDVIVVHENSKIRNKKEQQQAQTVKLIFNERAGESRSKDVQCQCPEEGVINAEAGTQYESNTILPVKSTTKLQKRKPYKKVHEEYFYDSCQCSKEYVLSVDANSQYQQPNNVESQNIGGRKTENQMSAVLISSTKTVKCACSNLKNQDTLTINSHKEYVNNGVQTSDRSIILEKNTACYPLFMKIVCADKLNDDCKTCQH